MPRSLPSFGVPVLCLLMVTAACSHQSTDTTITGPTPLNATSGNASFAVEPATLRPEPWPGSCGAHVPFGVRLGLTFPGEHDIILRGIRFAFTDRLGATAAPTIIPGMPNVTTPAPFAQTLPPASSITMPGMTSLPITSIPIPGASPIDGVLIRAGSSQRFDYILQFPCGVISDGVVVIVIDSADRSGRFGTAEMRVRVQP